MMSNARNKGYTLVELIVVVMIVAILSGITVTSALAIRSADVDAAANQLVSMVSTARSYGTSKANGSIWFELKQETSGAYYGYVYQGDPSNPATAEVVASEKIGGKTLTFTMKENSGGASTSTQISATQAAEMHFIKGTGGINEYYTDIEIAGSKTVNVVMIRETGRVIIE